MDREWLSQQLRAGASFAEVGRSIGRDGSTVAYWAKKHGLQSAGADRFSARGAPDRARLEASARRGATLAEIAAEVDRSIATVRYWLRRWGIERPRRRGVTRADPKDPAPTAEIRCRRHGWTTFRLDRRGYHRCARCAKEQVTEWRRRVKRVLVREAGGACRLCGYDRCVAALQFHHLDPSSKAFELSREGVTRSLAEARAEAQKCILLCANCHAKVESGVRRLDPATGPVGRPRNTPRGGFEPP